MRHGDGDGWVECRQGHRHWGRFGAAGLLLVAPAGDQILLQHRALWSHEGGTWGVPGGARRSSEAAVHGALREAAEEAGVAPEAVRPSATAVEDHGGWSYTTVLAEAAATVHAHPTDPESIDIAWVATDDVTGLPLHPAFGAAWPGLRPWLGRRLRIVVDVANVMGSTPDGWWRDRAGAADRLLRRLSSLASGVPAAAVGVPDAVLDAWLPEIVAVLEGAGRSATASPTGVDVRRAVGSGDDAVVAEVRQHHAARPGDVQLVVTADRGLAARVEAHGAVVARPSLLRRLEAP